MAQRLLLRGWAAGSTRSKAEYQLCQLNGRNLHKRTGGIDDKSKFNCLRPDRASIITLSDTAPLEIPFFTRIDGDLLTPKYVPIAVCYYITIRSGCVHKTNFIVLCQSDQSARPRPASTVKQAKVGQWLPRKSADLIVIFC